MMTTEANIFSSVPQKRWKELYRGNKLDAERVLEISSVKRKDIAKLAGIKPESVRLESERMSPRVFERIKEIAVVVELAAEYFDNDAERVSTWFTTKNPLLGSIAPRDMLRVGRYEKLLRFIMSARSDDLIP